VVIVLHFLGPLLSGVTDCTMPVRPLHTSFSDFLADQSRSGDYFVGESDIQMDIAVASFDPVLAEHVKDIVGNERILFWFEALSLLGLLGNSVPAFLSVGRWLQVSKFVR